MAGLSGATLTVTVVGSLDAWSRLAVTVAMPPASPIEVSDSDNVTVGAASSSAISTRASVTAKSGIAVVPLTSTVSAGSSTVSCVGVRTNEPVCEALFAGIVMVNPVTASKSVSAVAVPEPTVTVTGVAAALVPPFNAAVTVIGVAPAPSLTASGDTDSVTPLDGVSSSSTVTSTEPAVSPA